jgi:hypothetical protein
MNQIRLQPLNNTYQRISTLLCSTALNIQATDYTKTADWERLINQVNATHAAFKVRAEKEENILFPILHAYEPALVAILRDEQSKCLTYLASLSELFNSLRYATDGQKSRIFSNKLVYRFDEFVATTLQQIKEQETMINNVLWTYFSDKELVQLAASLAGISAAAPRKAETSFADHIIKNITIPAHNGYRHHPAATELALAI